MKKNKMQGRRPMPKMRKKTVSIEVGASAPSVGDLIAAAFDALGDSDAVMRVLQSNRLAERIGRKIVFI